MITRGSLRWCSTAGGPLEQSWASMSNSLMRHGQPCGRRPCATEGGVCLRETGNVCITPPETSFARPPQSAVIRLSWLFYADFHDYAWRSMTCSPGGNGLAGSHRSRLRGSSSLVCRLVFGPVPPCGASRVWCRLFLSLGRPVEWCCRARGERGLRSHSRAGARERSGSTEPLCPVTAEAVPARR